MQQDDRGSVKGLDHYRQIFILTRVLTKMQSSGGTNNHLKCNKTT
jgi:hypothetical protein